MLDIIAEAHRAALKAGTPELQKLFVMLKLLPTTAMARVRSPLAFALVIDTSDSMRDITGEGNKLDQVIGAAHALIDDPRLLPGDQVTIIHFDSTARALLPLSPLENRRAAHGAIDALTRQHGTTFMAQGMSCALQQLSRLAPSVAKRVLLLSSAGPARCVIFSPQGTTLAAGYSDEVRLWRL